jgi:hypothetical protein
VSFLALPDFGKDRSLRMNNALDCGVSSSGVRRGFDRARIACAQSWAQAAGQRRHLNTIVQVQLGGLS